MWSSPRSKGSRKLMQRRSVLFPEPLGPIITTTSPKSTVRSRPRSTWSRRNHLCTPRIAIILPELIGRPLLSWPRTRGHLLGCEAVCDSKPPLERAQDERDRVGHCEVHERHHSQDLERPECGQRHQLSAV